MEQHERRITDVKAGRGGLGMSRVQCIHFVGIGGAGMSGIAEVVINLGYMVTGSDLQNNIATTRLEKMGATIFIGHAETNITNASVVVISSAVKESNPEVVAAHELRIPVIPRAEMLAELMRFRYGIAVAGTHGKTTTTSLIASVLAEDGIDPTYVIGGKLNSSGSNAKLGTGRYLVAEADESDASFLHLQPMLSVITNIEEDHMETYEGDFSKLKQTFVEFLHNLPFYGLAVICIDDEVIRELINKINRPIRTYGLNESADIRAINIKHEGVLTKFTVVTPDNPTGLEIASKLPGDYNVLNTLAAISVAYEIGVSNEAIQTAFANFEGIGRRFEIYGEIKTNNGVVTHVDDYGHHPSEVAAVLKAIRSGWRDHRLVVVFQPHRYTRTRDLFEDFAMVLSEADVLVLLDVYPAGEAPISGADGRALSRAIRARGKVDPVFVKDMDAIGSTLKDIVADGDMLLTLGAGNIGAIATQMKDMLAK